MRNLTKITPGSRPGTLWGGALLVSGVLAISTAAVLGDPTAPRAEASGGLTPFHSCAELRQWYVAEAASSIGPYGWTDAGYPRMYAAAQDSAGGVPLSSTASGAAPERAVGNSATGTNTQEAGVDEPDVAKTDGRLLVRVVGRSLLVSDVTGDQPRALSSYQLPEAMAGAEVLLVGQRVVVVAPTNQAFARGGVMPMDSTAGTMPPVSAGASRLLTLDLSDPSQPREVSDRTYSGSAISVRQYGTTVRLVTSTPRPFLDFVTPQPGGLDETGATARNRALLAASPIGDWLPTVRGSSSPASAARPLVDCTNVLHPDVHSGIGTVAVTGFDVAAPNDTSSVAVTAGGDTVYSSTDALFVATSRTPIGPDLSMPLASGVGGDIAPTSPVQRAPLGRTLVHEFDLMGHAASYVASGSVPGIVKDRWSMDEYDGHLRLAVQTGSTMSFDDGATRAGANAIVTLARQGNRLVETGRVGGLGVGEEIKSVRWFDTVAVVVTFRQMDPLYTVDLTDPATPTLMGELKIPGFSGYLHPIGGGMLLGLGVDATAQGRSLGALVSLFDISDLHHPVQVAKQALGQDSYLSAVDDPRAFTWLPDAGVGLGQLQGWNDPNGGLRLARIAVSHGSLSVTTTQLAGVQQWDTSRVLPLPGGRVVLVSGTSAQTMTT